MLQILSKKNTPWSKTIPHSVQERGISLLFKTGHFLYTNPLNQRISSRLTTRSKNQRQPSRRMYTLAFGIGAEIVFARIIDEAVANMDRTGTHGENNLPVSINSLRKLMKKLRMCVTRKLKK